LIYYWTLYTAPPRLEGVPFVLKLQKRLIGLVGTNGAGKSAVCDYLSHIGFTVVSLSDIVRAELRHRQKPETRDTLVQTANDMKGQFGMDVLARRAYHESIEKDRPSIAFDSIRNLDEIIYLRDKGVSFLGIDAPIELRYDRVWLRKRASDLLDFETFKSQDARENTGQSAGQNIFRAFQECRTIIQNVGDLEGLHTDVKQFLMSEFGEGF